MRFSEVEVAQLSFQPVVRETERLLAEEGWSVIRTVCSGWAGQLTLSRPGQNGSAMVVFGPRLRNGEVPYSITRDLTSGGRILASERAPAETVALQLVHVIRRTLDPSISSVPSPAIERGLLAIEAADKDARRRSASARSGMSA